MIGIILAVIVGIIIGVIFASFYFRAKVEVIAKRLGEEMGQRIFEQRKTELEKSFEDRYKILFEQWKVDAEKRLREEAEKIGYSIFEQKKAELERGFEEKYRILFEQWRMKVEKELREDTLAKSRAVLKGKLAEQFAPFFAGFGYDPHDARFIGDPVDYIVFDGYTKVKERREDTPIKIVLVEVKTGKAGLTYEQRRILEGVKRGLVDFKIVEIEQMQPYIIKPPEDNPTSPHHDRSYSNTKIVKIDKFIRS